MTRGRTLARFAVRCGLAALLACAPAVCRAAAVRRNVILVVIDALRADHLSVYGYPRATSPNLERLADNDGIVFERAYAQATWTVAALGSIMTSLYPFQHGAQVAPGSADWLGELLSGRYRAPPGGRLPQGIRTLASTLRDHGYRTFGVCSGGFCRSEFGFSQGFDEYENTGDDADVIRRRLKARLGSLASGSRPFFAYLHINNVHQPYSPPPPFDRRWDPDYAGAVDGSTGTIARINARRLAATPRDLRHLVALYDGDIAYTDSVLGRLFQDLKEAGLWDKTVVIVTADHGEELDEHGYIGHSDPLYDEVLHIPWLMRVPGRGAGVRVAARVREIDLFPSVMEALGLPVPAGLEGRGALALAYGGREPERPVASQTQCFLKEWLQDPAVKAAGIKRRCGYSLIEGDWKYLLSLGDREELYDLRGDPHERRNLAPREPLLLERSRLRARQLKSAALARSRHAGERPRLGPDAESALRAAGYMQ